MEGVSLTLKDTTSAEVIDNFPEAEIVSAIETGTRGPVEVTIFGLDEESARDLAAQRGFEAD